MNVGVLASGSGTNLQALIDAQASAALGPARLCVVGANVPGCGALARARAAGVPAFVADHRGFPSRDAFDAALIAGLVAHGTELVVLAGFMRILTPRFLGAFPDRVINIHPSLLPAFPGVDAQGQAYRAGVKVAGCTVHLVELGVDGGPIIAQRAIAVDDLTGGGANHGDRDNDNDAERLRLRILDEEHRVLPTIVRAFAEGRVHLQPNRHVRVAAP